MLLRLVGTMLSGTLLVLAFAPFGYWPFAILSVALFMLFLIGERPWQAAIYGWWYGIGMFGAGVWWIQVSVHQFGVPHFWFSIPVTMIFIGMMACYLALFSWLLNSIPTNDEIYRAVVIAPALWGAIELVRATVFTGFPWLSLGYSQIDSNLSGYAPVIGIYGCSMLVVLTAGSLLGLIVGVWRQKLLSMILICIVFGFGSVLQRADWTEALNFRLEAALIQGAVPQEVKWANEMRGPSIELYRSLTEPHWDADIVIWPETAITAFPSEIPTVLKLIKARARETNTSLLAGMLRGVPSGGNYQNSVFSFGESEGYYDKRHLVPFGEFFPFKKVMEKLSVLLTIPVSDFSPGVENQRPLVVAGHRAGVSICYEIAFPWQIARALPEAAFLVNVSNDAWFGDTIAPHQHLEIARMRALENGRPLLRGTNSGITAAIDHRGTVVARSTQFEPNSVRVGFYPRQGATPYTIYGEVPVLVLIVLLMLPMAIRLIRPFSGK